MITTNMHEAKTNLSRLVRAVERGERVRLMRDGKPVAEIGPVSDAQKPLDRFAPHPWQGTIRFHESPDAPLDDSDWPAEHR